MKEKLITLALSGALVLALAACGGSTSGTAATAAPAATTPAPATATPAPAATAKPTEKPVEEPDDEELDEEYEETTTDVSEIEFNEALISMTKDENVMMVLTSDAEEYAVMAGINADGTLGMFVSGAYELDPASGSLYIYDEGGDDFDGYLLAATDEDGDDCLLLTTDGETGFYLYPADVEETQAMLVAAIAAMSAQ